MQWNDDLLWSLPFAPQGMNINISEGEITWQPSIGDTGIHTVTVYVTDNAKESDSITFYIIVVPYTAIGNKSNYTISHQRFKA